MTIEQLRDFIIQTFRLEIVTQDDTAIVFGYHDYKLELNISDINQKITQLETTLKKEETEIYNDRYYEILTVDSNRIVFGRDKFQTISDGVNG